MCTPSLLELSARAVLALPVRYRGKPLSYKWSPAGSRILTASHRRIKAYPCVKTMFERPFPTGAVGPETLESETDGKLSLNFISINIWRKKQTQAVLFILLAARIVMFGSVSGWMILGVVESNTSCLLVRAQRVTQRELLTKWDRFNARDFYRVQ